MNCDRGLIAPDAIIYLDMPVEDATKVSFWNSTLQFLFVF